MLNIPDKTSWFFFSHGRIALKYGLQSLGFEAGDELLVPDFICSVIEDPLQKLGIKAVYYPVTRELEPDWHALEKLKTGRVKGVMMVHYFGKAQDIPRFRDFCTRHSLLLIEDNAHGHGATSTFNGRLLGTFGDIGIASPRKFYSIMSGGILFLNSPDLKIPDISSVPFFPVNLKMKIFRSLSRMFPVIKAKLKKKMLKRPMFEDPRSFQEAPLADYRMDPVSFSEYQRIPWVELAGKKKHNYHRWEIFLKGSGCKPVYSGLSAGDAPQCYPVYVSNKQEAIKWFDWGWANGYYVYSWPSLPEIIIKENSGALAKWEILVCFSIDRVPTSNTQLP